MARAGRVVVEMVDTQRLTAPVARLAARKKASELCEIARYSPGLEYICIQLMDEGEISSIFNTCDTSLDSEASLTVQVTFSKI